MGNKQANDSKQEQEDEEEKQNVNIVNLNAETIIIVLGQCLLETGEAHQWMIDRVNKAYSLLLKHNLDLSTTYFIVSGDSGSDVSNIEYEKRNGKVPQPKHVSEAQMMYQLVVEIHNKNVNVNNDEKDLKHKNDFGSCILIEDQAMTTTQNFYYVFQMLDAFNIRDKIKTIFVVTSDFHMKRAKYNFDTMFFNQEKQIIGSCNDFKYEERVHFVSSETDWNDEEGKSKKYKKEEKICNSAYMQHQTITTAKKLWQTLQNT